MEEELYSRSLAIRQRGEDSNTWYRLDADYITHTPPCKPLAPTLYREGNSLGEAKRCPKSQQLGEGQR